MLFNSIDFYRLVVHHTTYIPFKPSLDIRVMSAFLQAHFMQKRAFSDAKFKFQKNLQKCYIIMKNTYKNEQIFESHFLPFSVKIFFTKLCLIIGPSNGLELALTLFAEPVAKEKG